MELPEPMENSHKLNDIAEIEERLRGKEAGAEAGIIKFLSVLAAGALITVIGGMSNSFTVHEPLRELMRRVALAAVLIWLPVSLLVFLFSAGEINWKKSLWMGSWPSIAALTPFAAIYFVFILIVLWVIYVPYLLIDQDS
jgi:hypothetical protein